MKFALDFEGRFQLVSRQGGWDLVVDDRRVHYCRAPQDALRYAIDEMMDDADVDGIADVVKALRDIEERVAAMRDIIVTQEMGKYALRYLDLVKDLEDHGACVKAVSLEMSQCQSTTELKADPNHKVVIARAKALLAPMFEARTSARR
jgi:hypothetical protein